jgi:hypothetical protein
MAWAIDVAAVTVPKIVPSGGLCPFSSLVSRLRKTRMNTSKTKHMQVELKC